AEKIKIISLENMAGRYKDGELDPRIQNIQPVSSGA
ncbi:hypothetical protein, partial [Coxiella burnetii]